VTGKTTYLTQMVEHAAAAIGGGSVLVSSFTKAAAEVVTSRSPSIPPDNIGTLHRFCFEAIGRMPVVEEKKAYIQEWNEFAPAYAMSMPGCKDMNSGLETPDGAMLGDKLLAQTTILRNKMIPDDQWPTATRAFQTQWKSWKAAVGGIDYTDMLEMALADCSQAPSHPRIIFVDEAQDCTALQFAVLRRWAQKTDRLVMVGDDDQCHPAGTDILTNRGYVSIEHLQEGDVIPSYDKRGQNLSLDSPRLKWKRAARPFAGNMVTITTDHSTLQATFDHRMMVRWNDKAIGKKCVYLMRRGSTWRIGTSDIIRNYAAGIFGVGQRARQEDADAAWIISVHCSESEALLHEDYISLKYGISKMVFVTPTCGQRLKHRQDCLDSHHSMILETADPARLLEDHGLHTSFPLWEKDGKQRGITAWQTVRACNLISDVMDVMSADLKQKTIKVKSDFVSCIVYSLNVEPYHHYIAQGIVTPNCIYQFAGATPEAFAIGEIGPGDRLLDQSYRVPYNVWEHATSWIAKIANRVEKPYSPRHDPDPGFVKRAPVTYKQGPQIAELIMKSLAKYDSVMVVGSCSYMLEPTKKALIEAGLPFHNPYRLIRADWNPLRLATGTTYAQRVTAFLRPQADGKAWTATEIKEWGDVLQAEGVFNRGFKKKFHEEEYAATPAYRVLLDFFTPEAMERALAFDLNWWTDNLVNEAAERKAAYPLKVVEQWGASFLDAAEIPPSVTLGTIHSVKGGEADVVIVIPDLSQEGMMEWTGKGKAAIRRLMYVAVTRARQGVFICKPASPYTCNL